ncbi:MAG: dynamin family protein, partial [Oscillibacter sp.]|nr:dynamin family protein [Oscillibacter sp.]
MEKSVDEKLRDNFSLLCEIIREPSKNQKLKADLSRIEDIIRDEIPDALKKNAPEDFYVLYTDFKAEYERFRDFILYDKLIGKNVVALGGGFSSGKSSFLNALMGGRKILPEDLDPSTAVPTYIVRGKEHEAHGLNVFDAQVTLNIRRGDLRNIA